jgi:hypothetical protein
MLLWRIFPSWYDHSFLSLMAFSVRFSFPSHLFIQTTDRADKGCINTNAIIIFPGQNTNIFIRFTYFLLNKSKEETTTLNDPNSIARSKMFLHQLTQLLIAVLAASLNMGNAYNEQEADYKVRVEGGVLIEQQGMMKSSSTTTTSVERSLLGSIFQVMITDDEDGIDNDNGGVLDNGSAESGNVVASASKNSLLLAALKAPKASKSKKAKSTKKPTRQPTRQPTSQPTSQPTTLSMSGSMSMGTGGESKNHETATTANAESESSESIIVLAASPTTPKATTKESKSVKTKTSQPTISKAKKTKSTKKPTRQPTSQPTSQPTTLSMSGSMSMGNHPEKKTTATAATPVKNVFA